MYTYKIIGDNLYTFPLGLFRIRTHLFVDILVMFITNFIAQRAIGIRLTGRWWGKSDYNISIFHTYPFSIPPNLLS